MRYVVIDLQGNQRAALDSREELVEELREIDDPATVRSLYVLVRDESGREVGTARADEVLARLPTSRRAQRAVILDFIHSAVAQVGAPESNRQYQEFVAQYAGAPASRTG